jgi:hypothetical protein
MGFDGGRQGRENGEEFGADAVAEEAGARVRRVFAPGEAVFGEVGADGVARERKERTDEAGAGGGENAAEAGGSGAAQEAEKDGFGLVGGGMAGGDAVDLTGVDPGGEQTEAFAAAVLFEIAGDGLAGSGEKREIGGELADEGLVGVGGGAAEAVVDVEDDEGSVVAAAESVEEEDTIGAAGDGDLPAPRATTRSTRRSARA